jgi:6,7-dimethyl-8-ribityllumazine synthase
MTAPEHLPGPGVFTADGVVAEGGKRDAQGLRVGIAVARFNTGATSRLFAGAVHALKEMGVAEEDIAAVHVPGAMELPLAAQMLVERADRDAVVALGCVIRGDTAHFEYVCDVANSGLLRVQLDTRVPVGFGLITAETAPQAEERSQLPPGRNLGVDAARAAIEMALLPSAHSQLARHPG